MKTESEKREEQRQQREKLAALTPTEYRAAREAVLHKLAGTTTNPRNIR